MPSLKELLVVIPHSGILVPPEISFSQLAADFHALLRNVDWYTNWLYDFTDLLGNRQLTFPYCSLILEANRHPEILDDCVPLRDVNGEPIYRPGSEPDDGLRRQLAARYLRAFNTRIQGQIRG